MATTARSVVPLPARIAERSGRPVVLADPIRIAAPAGLASEARWFRRCLEEAGVTVELVTPGETAVLVLDVSDSSAGAPSGSGRLPGAYRLVAGDNRIAITGADACGLFYGLQTLRQLLPDATLRRAPTGEAAFFQALAVEPVEIHDWPRLGWRGVHLDVSRHFMPKGFILEMIDLAAFHKSNVFHLHLTDDQGWRVPIDRYPRLIDVGAWRRRSPAGHAVERRYDSSPHGGFYTKDDLREIVAFAASRHVTVLPEVDMPGHVGAALAAYPQLGNTAEQLEVCTDWGVSVHVLNLEEATMRFCMDVVDEVLELFPGRWFHIGGDESPTHEWESSPRAAHLMGEHGYTQARQLQGWFSARLADHLARSGRTPVGWDDILDSGAPPGTVVMSWHGVEEAIAATRAGLDVVMAPQDWLYFDWSYSDDPAEPLAFRGSTPVEKVYAFEPLSPRIPEGMRHHVLGAQCQLWTEYVSTPAAAEYQYFPRLCAFAETVWSPPAPDGEARSYAGFEPRLARHLGRLSALGVNYRPLDGPTPGQARIWRPDPKPD